MGKKNRKGMDIIVRNVEASAKAINIQVNIDGNGAPAAAVPTAPAAPVNRAARRSDARTNTNPNRPKFVLPEGQRVFRCLAIHPENDTTCAFGAITVPTESGVPAVLTNAAIGDAKAMSTIPGLTNGDAYNKNGLRCPACAAANRPFQPESKVTCEAAMTSFAKKAPTAVVPSQGSISTDTSTGTLSAADLVASAAAQIAANLGTERIPEDDTDLGNASTNALA